MSSLNLSHLARISAVRYFIPFDAEGRFDPLLLRQFAPIYLRRNVTVSLLLYALQQPLSGLPLTSLWPTTPWQMVYVLLPTPFVNMAVISLMAMLDFDR